MHADAAVVHLSHRRRRVWAQSCSSSKLVCVAEPDGRYAATTWSCSKLLVPGCLTTCTRADEADAIGNHCGLLAIEAAQGDEEYGGSERRRAAAGALDVNLHEGERVARVGKGVGRGWAPVVSAGLGMARQPPHWLAGCWLHPPRPPALQAACRPQAPTVMMATLPSGSKASAVGGVVTGVGP